MPASNAMRDDLIAALMYEMVIKLACLFSFDESKGGIK